MDPAGLARALKAKALALGFDLAGIAPAAPLPEAAAYDRWVTAGMHGTMGYMAENRDSRHDIRRWDKDARSVLMLATAYFKRVPAGDTAEQGRLACYALTPDYHDVIAARMRELKEWIRHNAHAHAVPFVDTSPLLERLYARYAGIGWVGKNAMILSRGIGSYFFLSGMTINVDLPADEPEADHCGTCTKCLDACPTDAFPSPRVLDASRCIAYLTIEHRGPVPEPLREGVGNWLFGCDICQDVCPWNRFAKESREPAVLDGLMGLEEAARLTLEEFRKRMKPTPVRRGKWQGWVRNALLAMGNSGNRRFLPLLEEFSAHADPVLAEQAAWSRTRLNGNTYLTDT